MTYQERLFRQSTGFGCEPSTIIGITSLVVSAVGTGLSLDQQRQNQKAQTEYQTNLTKSQNKATEQQQAALRLQEAQLAEATAREDERARLANERAKATAVTAAGEAGVSGASYDAILQEFNTQLSQYREASGRQLGLQRLQIGQQIEGLSLSNTNTNMSINAPIAGPNYAAAAANFAGDALGAYRAYNPDAFRKQPSTKKT